MNCIDNDHRDIRSAVRALCAQFPDEYFRRIDDESGYPEEFVRALTLSAENWLAARVPEAPEGRGLRMEEACVIVEEVNRCGGTSGAFHAQACVSHAIGRHGTPEQRAYYQGALTSGASCVRSMAVTEPVDDAPPFRAKVRAERRDGFWVLNGKRAAISRMRQGRLLLLMARTTPLVDVQKRVAGLSCFIVDLDEAVGRGLTIHPAAGKSCREELELSFDQLEIPETSLLGAEGEGFRVVLDGLNAERVLIASACIGDAHWFKGRARPGEIRDADSYPGSDACLETAILMRWQACHKIDAGQAANADAKAAKALAARARGEAADACLRTHGSFGFACEYDIERKIRETRRYQVEPASGKDVGVGRGGCGRARGRAKPGAPFLE